ncbi:MAG: amidohydrolase family protein [Treponema sp.]|nr:amidohydrolase family protein [Treponema sp.]
MNALVIYNAHLVDETVSSFGAVVCVDGKILAVLQGNYKNRKTAEDSAHAILSENGFVDGDTVDFFDAEGLTLTPAFIDMHVHFRDPGLTEKEDLESGLRAAIAGGYGTVVAMPNTKPVVSSAEDALSLVSRAKKIDLCHFYQSVSITRDFLGTDISHLEALDSSAVPLITEDGHDVDSANTMFEAMKTASSKGMIVSCHCEDSSFAKAATPHRKAALDLMEKYAIPVYGHNVDTGDVPEDVREEIRAELLKANESLYIAENIATMRNIELARMADCHIHICHISTKEAIDAVSYAKEISFDNETSSGNHNGFRVTAEATPHHIALSDEGANIRALVNPPLRSECDRLALIEAIRNGTIDCIATDHAPHTFEDKKNGAPGFTGLECAYSVCNTVLVKSGEISEQDLSRLMSAAPARILHLNKGVFRVGYDADFALLDPNEKRVIHTKDFYSKGKATPFDGKTVFGGVKEVFIDGKKKAL